MRSTASESEQPIVESPREGDVFAIARMFQADMRDLGLDVPIAKLESLSKAVLEGAHADPPTCLCWVARLAPGADPCGVLLANFHWSLKFGGRALWIEELYVAPEARRRSLGRQLVEALLDFAEDNDLAGIDLEAYQGNTPASILYRSLGFRRLGRERFYYAIESGHGLK